MGVLASAVVDIGANLNPLRTGLASAKTMLQGFTGSMGADVKIPITLAMGAGGIGLSGMIAGLGEAAVKASKLLEATNKIKVTFGPEAGGILAATDELADKFGIVKTTAESTAANFGLLGKAAGMTVKQQADFAKEFTQLAVDLASFHFTSHAEAVQKLLSGLEGMPRPLREFGIFLSEEKVKAEAAALGIAHHGKELTEEEKILARVSIIRREAGAASGDAERSLGRNFEQMKKFWGDIENAVTDFGKDLQGALSEGMKAARALGKIFQEEFGKGFGSKIGEGLKTTAENWKSIFDTFRALRQPSAPGRIKNLQDFWEAQGEKLLPEKMKEIGGAGPIKGGLPATWEDWFLRERRKLIDQSVGQIRSMAEEARGEKGRGILEQLGLLRGAPKEAIPAVPKVFDFLRDFTSPLGMLRAGLRGEGPQFGLLRAGLAPLAQGRPLTEEEEMQKDIIESHNKEVRRNRIMRRLGLEERTPVQAFGDPEEYGRALVQGALEGDKGQMEKEIVDTLKANQTNLTEDGRQIIQAIRSFLPNLGIIPR